MSVSITISGEPALRGPFGGRKVSIQVQSILYNNNPKDIDRSLKSLHRAAELAMFEGICDRIVVRYGDCSPSACVSDNDIADLRATYADILNLEFTFFNANLGSALGHNNLAKLATTDFLLIQNPDVVVSPRIFEGLLEPFRKTDTGMTEAKQLPVEHPKDYNILTGETGWATTACALIPKLLFDELGCFDSDTFFLYCDDVDFSWSVRRAGFKVIFQPSAVVFHDKRLSDAGEWQPSIAERYYSAEAALLLAHKWSRPDIVKKILSHFDVHGDEHQIRASKEYRRREGIGELPKAIDSDRKIGFFENNCYTHHRYAL